MSKSVSHLVAHRRLVVCAIAGVIGAALWQGPGAGSALSRALVGWNTLAWLYLPGYAVPPLPGEPDPGRPAGPAPVWDPDRTDPRLRMIGSVFGPGSVFDATSMHHRQIDQLYRDADPEER